MTSHRSRPLKAEEIRSAFANSGSNSLPAILSPTLLAEVLGLSRKTIYEWLSKGRLDGAYRKRGKHCLIWRDRAIEALFNGPEWNK